MEFLVVDEDAALSPIHELQIVLWSSSCSNQATSAPLAIQVGRGDHHQVLLAGRLAFGVEIGPDPIESAEPSAGHVNDCRPPRHAPT